MALIASKIAKEFRLRRIALFDANAFVDMALRRRLKVSLRAKIRSAALVPVILLPISACAITEPVVVISQNGETLRGTTRASVFGGAFSVTDGILTCAGNYNAMDPSITISMPVTCSDGRRGIVIATRDASGLSGSGTVRLSDGSTATFLFGSAAAGF